MQYLPIVHEHKRYFNWFIVAYTEQYFRYCIFQGKTYHTMHIMEVKHSSSMASQFYRQFSQLKSGY